MSNWRDLKENPRLKKNNDIRIEILKLIREFFWSQNFAETETPIAIKFPGQEPYLNPISVNFHDPNGHEEKFYLHTSPEFAMKKLLAAGYEKIFQITKCFRDYEEFGGLHNTEFTMIEWYRSPGDFIEIMNDTEELFKFVGKKLEVENLTFKDKKIKISGPWDRLTMKEIWEKYLNVNLDDYLSLEALKKLTSELGFSVNEDDAYEDLFYKIFLNKIESNLGIDKPVFIYNYPAGMASLSRLCASDSRYAERFELYIGGVELANAFGELTDAEDQNTRLEMDEEHRKTLGKETWPVDPGFIDALKSGIRPAGGIALGVDRMILLFTGARNLDEVIFQSVKDQITE